MTDETKVKLLGIEWNTSKDKFIWNWKIPQGGLQTKRQILQFYAAIYDPLGLLSPIILPWKILIQDLWKKGMSWDEKLELEEMRRCSELEKAFNQFNVIEVTRWIPQEYSEIHVFVDASERAVGLAVYARRSSSMTCKPQLIYGKTRLIPKRESRKLSVSIPRLELLAVTLGIRALEFIRQEIEVRKTYLWSDSACALHWLRKPPVGSRYISNRIDEVRRCKGIEFHHVRSTDNPADKASRGLLPEKLKDDLLWWNGPSWLWEQKENWPEDKIMQESVISVCMNMGLLAEEEIQSPEVITLIDVTRFSSLLKLTKTILYVLRFIAKISKDKIKNLKDFSRDNFTYKEYEKTTQLLVRMAQSSITQKEIEHWV
uniref:Integrase catalytic domain-containing protein n=1 Tax=Loa loa TaxID=7209 RepID=A0A1I7V9Y0_LOALO